MNLEEASDNNMMKKVRAALRELESKGYLKSFDISGSGSISIVKSNEAAINVDGQILGMDRFHISRLGGPGSDLE